MRLERLDALDLETPPKGLAELCEGLHKEYDYPLPWDTDVFFEAMQTFLAGGYGYFAVVFNDRDLPISVMGGVIAPDFYGGGRLKADELFWLVDPDHRSAGVGRVAFQDWEAWAEEHGAALVTMCHLAGLNPEVGKMYEANGYEPLETHYWKALR